MKIKNLVIFGFGVLIGSAITYKVVSDKYENLIDEEIESVKESLGFYNRSVVEDEGESIDEKTDKEPKVYNPLDADKKDYANLISYHKYYRESDKPEDGDDEQHEIIDDYPGIEYHKIESSNGHSFKDNIYPIPPEEYGAMCDYDLIDLTLYSDGVLCDDMDEIVEDIDTKVGSDYASYFGKYEDSDVINFRNDILKCDYEITKDLREYADVVWGRPPHLDV